MWKLPIFNLKALKMFSIIPCNHDKTIQHVNIKPTKLKLPTIQYAWIQI